MLIKLVSLEQPPTLVAFTGDGTEHKFKEDHVKFRSSSPGLL